MKEEKKLLLGKVTIQNLNSTLEKDEQQAVKSGVNEANTLQTGTTVLPIFCKR